MNSGADQRLVDWLAVGRAALACCVAIMAHTAVHCALNRLEFPLPQGLLFCLWVMFAHRSMNPEGRYTEP